MTDDLISRKAALELLGEPTSAGLQRGGGGAENHSAASRGSCPCGAWEVDYDGRNEATGISPSSSMFCM